MHPLFPSQHSHLSPAFTSRQELAETRVASHLCQQPVCLWSSTTWSCSSRRAISPLIHSLPVAEIWKFSCQSPLPSFTSTVLSVCPNCLTQRQIRSFVLHLLGSGRRSDGAVSEKNLYVNTQHYISNSQLFPDLLIFLHSVINKSILIWWAIPKQSREYIRNIL